MARYRKAVCRLCRRENTKLFLKGDRCLGEKCAFNRRAFAPGQHGKMRKKISDYAVQLREKQKVRRIYGIGERQFRLYFHRAEQTKGVTGTALLQLLELRLDNVVFSLGFASSRSQARQMVRHKFFMVNSRPVNIPSYSLKPEDQVTVRPDENKLKLVRQITKSTKDRGLCSWLEFDAEKLQATVLRLPAREDIQFPVQEQLIVELYSK